MIKKSGAVGFCIYDGHSVTLLGLLLAGGQVLTLTLCTGLVFTGRNIIGHCVSAAVRHVVLAVVVLRVGERLEDVQI